MDFLEEKWPIVMCLLAEAWEIILPRFTFFQHEKLIHMKIFKQPKKPIRNLQISLRVHKNMIHSSLGKFFFSFIHIKQPRSVGQSPSKNKVFGAFLSSLLQFEIGSPFLIKKTRLTILG
jgi:hypothetical protein